MNSDEFFDSPVLPTSGAEQAKLVGKSGYKTSYRFINITSHSQRAESLHSCPRKFQQLKIPRAEISDFIGNIDFTFGHCLGALCQTYACTSDELQSFYAGFLAWNLDLTDSHEKKQKSFYLAYLALHKFIPIWQELYAAGWRVATFRGRQASEVSFWIDCENGYYHAGHMDLVLQHSISGAYMVTDIKSTSLREPDEAMYGNSGQGLGYSIVVDAVAQVAEGVSSFDVLYLCYSTTTRKWYQIPFKKQRAERAEWLQDLLLDHTTINTYRKLRFFPKRGNACWSFSRRCQYYGICDLQPNRRTDFEEWREGMDLPEQYDFQFRLSDLVAAQ